MKDFYEAFIAFRDAPSNTTAAILMREINRMDQLNSIAHEALEAVREFLMMGDTP